MLQVWKSWVGGLVGGRRTPLCSPASIIPALKSVNLQYITLVCLDDGPNESSTKRQMFKVLLFFHYFLYLGHSNLFIFISVIFLKKIKE